MVTSGQGFASGVTAWRQGLSKVRNEVRQELVARQLAAHLPPEPQSRAAATGAGGATTVLDVGCGQGTQAILLARAGHQVLGVDVSEELLATAREAAAREVGAEQPPDVGTRLRFEQGDLLTVGEGYRDRFDVVCCHGVLMYLPSLDQGVAAVVAATRPGGLISVLTRNRAGIAMRAGMSGDWGAAREGFDARYYRNRLGVNDVRADEPEEVAQALERAGASRVAWYGVRLFTDHWGDVDAPADPDDLSALISAEEEAGRRDPYRSVAALTHTIARRGTG